MDVSKIHSLPQLSIFFLGGGSAKLERTRKMEHEVEISIFLVCSGLIFLCKCFVWSSSLLDWMYSNLAESRQEPSKLGT